MSRQPNRSWDSWVFKESLSACTSGTHPPVEVTASTLHTVLHLFGTGSFVVNTVLDVIIWEVASLCLQQLCSYVSVQRSQPWCQKESSNDFWTDPTGWWRMFVSGCLRLEGRNIASCLLIRNNEGKEIKSCCLLALIQRDIDQLKLLNVPSKIISSP